jgi:hypothetical protein
MATEGMVSNDEVFEDILSKDEEGLSGDDRE